MSLRLPMPLRYYLHRHEYLHPDNVIFLSPGNIFMLRDGRVYKVGYDEIFQLPVKSWHAQQEEARAKEKKAKKDDADD